MGQKGAARGEVSTSTSLLPAEHTALISPPRHTSLTASTAPNVPLADQALCYFIANYLPTQGTAWGYMEFIIPLLTTGKVANHFQISFEACALASLNNRFGNCFEELVLQKYTEALATIAIAIRNAKAMEQDETLASVLLLGCFETIAASSTGMMAWSSHTEGAVQLAKIRHRKQAHSEVGLSMIKTMATQMVSYEAPCLVPSKYWR